MGVQIVNVPSNWQHPTDEQGDYIPGGHFEPLHYMDSVARSACQLYENVSEGSPISPVFASSEHLATWLKQEGWPDESMRFLLANGHAPSMVVRR